LKKIKNIITKIRLDKSYLVTLATSFIVAVIIFTSSFFITDLVWQGLFVSLSASVLAIGIAILIVDYIRERHLESQYRAPREVAFRKIVGMHSVLALTIAMKNIKKDRTILQEITSRIQSDQSAQGFLETGSIVAIRKLVKLKPGEILSDFTRGEVEGTLKTSFESLSKTYSEISDLYLFSFNDIAMRSSYVELLEKLNTLMASFSIVALGNNELDKLFQPVDPDAHGGESMTFESFLSAMLITYLEKYLDFLDEYIYPEKTKSV
jgi:hypothetical protein